MAKDWYFEDFAAGQVFRSTGHEMTAERIKAFGAEFDPQPQHLDEAQAAASHFGALVASGWHTLAASMRLTIRDGFPHVPGGGQGLGLERLAWKKPVFPGDVIRVENAILETRLSKSRPGKGLLTIRCTTFNQHDEPVQEFTSTVMVPCRP